SNIIDDYQKFYHKKALQVHELVALFIVLITKQPTPETFFRWFFFLIFVFIIYFFELFIVYCGWFFIEVFIFFLFRYIFMLHLCRLFPFLLLISIFRLSSKCCFLYINILSLINRRIKRIIKSSFFL